MEHDPKVLQPLFQSAAPPDLDITFRAMFGGILAYVDGKPVASLSNIGLALKLAGADHEALLALPGAKALKYEPDSPPSKSYVVVPEPMLGDPATLRAWIARAAECLKTVVKKPRKQAK